MSVKVDVLWSPNHPDRFLTFSNELVLYSVDRVVSEPRPVIEPRPHAVRISDDTIAYKEAVNASHQYLKCVAWCPTQQPDHLLALGQANGRVSLASFGKGGSPDPHSLIDKEFSPKHARQCHQLEWNRREANLLAVGLEKSRSDCSILIWDVNMRPGPERHGSQTHDLHLVSRPLVEFGYSDVTSSLAWSPHEDRILFTGMGNKFLRRYDIRDTTHHQNAAVTKAVHGVCLDPHCEYRLASFVDDQVLMWDVRSFDRPVLTYRENRNITKIAWCPTRFGLLASLTKDSGVVKLYDVQHSGLGNDELEPAISERHIHPYSPQQAVSAFSWHYSDENRMLTVTPSGHVRDVLIFERIALTWSPSSALTWTCGRRFIDCQARDGGQTREDISAVMRQRALSGYGLSVQDSADSELSDEETRNAWLWLDLVKRHKDDYGKKALVSQGGSQKPYSRISGARSVIKGEVSAQCSKSEASYTQPGQDFGHLSRIRQYKSDERTKILDLCGWDFLKTEQALKNFIERLESTKDYERASAICLFNLRLRQTIEVLKRGSQSDSALNIVAMALAGFSDVQTSNSMWREMCSSMRHQLVNPYLRAMFAFLTADSDSHYDRVLEEQDVPLRDRLAFACLYLSDQRLSEFIDHGAETLTQAGKLEGLLLTGLAREGVDLLQNFVDRTGDVQTAALIAIQAFPGEICRDPRVQAWIDSYRELLDRWRLWHHRAEFDVHRYRDDTQKPAEQVFVSCNFCGKSISYQKMMSTRARHFQLRGPIPNISKISSCPSCRKPLPRCSLCLLNMGTASGTSQEPSQTGPVSAFSSWFTWCQTCRHGGHASHVATWFSQHGECPVSGCTCRCMALDAALSSVPAAHAQSC